MAIRDPYEVLGLDRNASADEIKSTYRRLARRYHPDVNPGDPEAEERFKEIGEAYSILSDPERRERFDRFGTADEVPMGDFFGGAGGGGLGDIFEMFFGAAGGGRRNFGVNGEDLQTTVNISLSDVVQGTTRPISYTRMATCDACSGQGTEGGVEPETCATCRGTGAVIRTQNTFLGAVRTQAPCNTCGGRGKIIRNPCKACDGTQRKSEQRSMDVRIPAGIEDRAAIQVPGAGGDPIGFGRSGDLYVVVQIEDMQGFERDDRDLHAELKLSFAQATLGSKVEPKAIDEAVVLHVPAGSQPGDTIVAKGHGLPPLHGGRRGDIVYHLTVDVPRQLTEQQRVLVEQLAQAFGEPKIEAKDSLLGGLFKKKK